MLWRFLSYELSDRLSRFSDLCDRKAGKAENPILGAFMSGRSYGLFESADEIRKAVRSYQTKVTEKTTRQLKQTENNKGVLGMRCCVVGDLPSYAHEGDAGMDIRASEHAIIHKGEYKVVHTGLHIECPEGHVAYVMPRSGLAVKNGITVLNAPGVVDSGYRGEIVVPLINLGREVFEVEPGDRIAQLIISPYTTVSPIAVESLGDSARGSDGLGSTGVK